MLRAIYNALWWIIAPLAVLRLLIRFAQGARLSRAYRRAFRLCARPVAGRQRAADLGACGIGGRDARRAAADRRADESASRRAHSVDAHDAERPRNRQEIFGDRVLRSYLPYDMPHAVRRFLRTWRPSLGLVMETEVWPTLIDECRRADVPLVLTNARMSARSYKRAAKFGGATKDVFGGFARVLAQSPADAERLTALGARNVAVLGNLKFDMSTPPELAARGHAWRAAIGTRPVWVAASTREGEEELVLQAFAALASTVRIADSGAASSATV
jgi:3-deoxy-D-manno-octulosonic-acid transferase